MSNLICVGTIVATHGVKGRVKIKTFTEDPDSIVAYGDLCDSRGKIYQIKITGHQPSNLLAEIEGVNSMNDAELLIGKELFVQRNKMPAPDEGTYYYSDLVGLEVRMIDGSVFGSVKAIENYGAGEIVEISKIDGKNEMHALRKDVFTEIHIAKGYVVFCPPEVIEAK